MSSDNIIECLAKLEELSGFIGASLVDASNGLLLGCIGGSNQLNIEIASAANTDVVKAKRKAIEALNLNQKIEDILITLESQYHLIRPLANKPLVFLYVALSRNAANLALARYSLTDVEKQVRF